MGLRETEAIILRSYKLGEADKIVLALTRHMGLVRGVARGARRLKSRFGASLEPFTLIHLSFYEKETSELVSFRQTEIVASYFGLARRDCVYVTLEYLADLTLEFAPPHAPDEKQFRMVRACLEALNSSPETLHAVARYFEIWTLKLAGLLPDLKSCGSCGREHGDENGRARLVHAGGFHCNGCATGGEGIAISCGTLGYLREALRQSPRTWAGDAQTLSATARDEQRRVLQLLLSRALERAPRAQAVHYGQLLYS